MTEQPRRIVTGQLVCGRCHSARFYPVDPVACRLVCEGCGAEEALSLPWPFRLHLTEIEQGPVMQDSGDEVAS
jgi:hypothetical protein